MRVPRQAVSGMTRLPAPRPVGRTLPRRTATLLATGLTLSLAAGPGRNRLLRRPRAGGVAARAQLTPQPPAPPRPRPPHRPPLSVPNVPRLLQAPHPRAP